MRKNLRYASVVSAAFLMISSFSQAQDRFAYAITDVQQNTAGWTSLRKLNLKTGEYSDVLFSGLNPSQIVFDATTKKQIEFTPDAKFGTSLDMPFSSGVAALAYDNKNNRIYFTPMFVDQLRYVDLKTMKVYYVTDES